MRLGDKIVIGAVVLFGTYIAGLAKGSELTERRLYNERKERIRETINRVKINRGY